MSITEPTTTESRAGDLIGDGAWRLDPARSSVAFHVRHFYGLMTVKGEFADYEGTLDFSATPAVQLTIQAASLDTKQNKRDEHLHSDDFFDAERHPQVHFISDSARLDRDTLHVRGQLQVYGFLLHANPTAHHGAWAELITTGEELQIAPAPAGVDLATAGAAPLTGITAMMSVDALDLHDGDVVLVVGATGGVGSLAVQLAARAGARVLAPGLAEDEAFLRELGVSEVLPRDGNIVELVREGHSDGVDALLDLVNYTAGTYDAALKTGARVASPTGATGEGPGRTMVMAAPTPENLGRLAALLAEGTLHIPVQGTYELTEAPAALQALSSEHTQGKLAIRIR